LQQKRSAASNNTQERGDRQLNQKSTGSMVTHLAIQTGQGFSAESESLKLSKLQNLAIAEAIVRMRAPSGSMAAILTFGASHFKYRLTHANSISHIDCHWCVAQTVAVHECTIFGVLIDDR